MAQPDESRNSSISWLLRLRWTAVAGQLATILFVALGMRIPLPLYPLAGILVFTAISNVILHYLPAYRRRRPIETLFAAIMALDILLLTAMLYWTGGVHNPFTSFYLVHIALAAMVIRARHLWALVVLCGGGFAWLFFFFRPLCCLSHEVHGDGFQLHLRGMVAAFVLTSACIAYFSRRMQGTLRRREAELADARLRAARHEQFSALATLSAGVAHELGSPLGTIAIVSHELERALEVGKNNREALADARLIRAEVDRCRVILDRLNTGSTGGVGDAPDRFDTATLIREVRASQGQMNAARLRTKSPEDLGFLFLPLAPLAQALGVLIQNACDADPLGQPVILELQREPKRAIFKVSDRGSGLSPAAQTRAGEPFFTTKPHGRGMGLGLFLVRTLAVRLGGELTLASNPGGKGTCATLSLPVPVNSPVPV